MLKASKQKLIQNMYQSHTHFGAQKLRGNLNPIFF